MATPLQNDKRFLVIKMSWREYVAATDTWGWCDLCGFNEFGDEEGYYIAVINQWYCKKCYDAWYSTATHYKVDTEKERASYNVIMNKLKGMGVWNIQKNG